MSEITKNKSKLMPHIPFAIQVDGGINKKTAAQCVSAGANVLISGSYLFEGNMKQKITHLKELSL